jgi:hypothetical protein
MGNNISFGATVLAFDINDVRRYRKSETYLGRGDDVSEPFSLDYLLHYK